MYSLVEHRNYSAFKLEAIECGVLFVELPESAGSQRCLKALKASLTEDYGQTVILHLLDARIVTDDLLVAGDGTSGKLGVVYHGNGETFWIKDGKVLRTLVFCSDYSSKAAAYTRELMNGSSGEVS